MAMYPSTHLTKLFLNLLFLRFFSQVTRLSSIVSQPKKVVFVVVVDVVFVVIFVVVFIVVVVLGVIFVAVVIIVGPKLNLKFS